MLTDNAVTSIVVFWALTFLFVIIVILKNANFLRSHITLVTLSLVLMALPGVFLFGRYGNVTCESLTIENRCLCLALDWVQNERLKGHSVGQNDVPECESTELLILK